jgi:ferric-dicitrate binding protein FerR (iron transport regulator)
MTERSKPGHGEARDDEIDVVRWLRLTSPRPVVETERTARVRAAVHQAWRNALKQRQRQYRMWWTAAAAIALVSTMGAWMWNRGVEPTPSPRSAVGVVLALSGASPVMMRTPEGARPLQVGDAVSLGADVRTNAPASLSWLEPRVQVRVDANTNLRFNGPRVVFVERGRVYFDTGSNGARAIEVQTPRGTVHDVGTRFEVRVSDVNMRVRVRDGAVKVTRGSVAREGGAGTELTVTGEAIVERTIATSDTDWAWITRAGPRFVLEGQTLESYLQWVSIEGGWTVRFADDRRGRETRNTVLHGSIDGLSPAESLEVVLPTCGLTHRMEGDVVTIDVATDQTRGFR